MSADHQPRRHVAVGALLTAGFAALLVAGLAGLPREHDPLPPIARYALEVALPRWKLTEPVNEVVYGTRGFDTFGETFLLLAAVLSVIVLTRPREGRRGYFGESAAGQEEQAELDPIETGPAEEQEARRAERGESRGDRPSTPDSTPLGTPGPETAEAMSVVVRGAVRTVLPVLAVAGLYLVTWGYSPGGGFPAGAVVTGVILLVYAAYGRSRIARAVKSETLEGIEMAGAGLILGTELLGLILRGSFSANWLPLAPPQTIRSGGVVQLFSFGELFEVATGLTIVIFSLLSMGHDWSPDPESEGDEE